MGNIASLTDTGLNLLAAEQNQREQKRALSRQRRQREARARSEDQNNIRRIKTQMENQIARERARFAANGATNRSSSLSSLLRNIDQSSNTQINSISSLAELRQKEARSSRNLANRNLLDISRILVGSRRLR